MSLVKDWQLAISVIGWAMVIGWPQAVAEEAFPRKPIKVVVPFDAGGGSDTFTRVVVKAIETHNLLPQPLVVLNVPGAGGSIGSRRVKNSRPDGYTILQLHEGILTNRYSGNTRYGPESFEPILGTGIMPHIIAVHRSSPYDNLQQLLSAATQQPDSIIFAVGIGAPSHFTGLRLEHAAGGAKFRYAQSGGGAKRLSSLLGKHAMVTTFSLAEYMDFQESGLKALAILSSQRHPEAASIPTAVEQGYQVVSSNMHFWWAPRGTPVSRTQRLAEAIDAAMQTPEVKKFLAQSRTEAVLVRGTDLFAELRDREQAIQQVALAGTAKPSAFPIAIGVACLVSIGLALICGHGGLALPRQGDRTVFGQAAGVFALLIIYVATLQLGWLDFRWATILFFSASGGLLAANAKQRCMVPAFGVIFGFGLHAIFSRLLIIDLP